MELGVTEPQGCGGFEGCRTCKMVGVRLGLGDAGLAQSRGCGEVPLELIHKK